MQWSARYSDRLLRWSARAIGLSTLGISLFCVCLQGVLPPPVLISTLPFYFLAGACLFRLGWSRSLLWVGPGLLAALVILVLVQLPLGQGATPTVATAVLPIAGGTIPAFALVLYGSVVRIAILVSAFTSSVVLMWLADGSPRLPFMQSATLWLGWVLVIAFAFWLRVSMGRAFTRVASIGRAHRVERESSEIEAQRRRSARLLHDTVLATLTLLAHSGIGVTPEVLKERAASDARLLRQLRLEGTAPGGDSARSDRSAAMDLNPQFRTLQNLKSHYERADFAVKWHGTSDVPLADHLLETFLLALAECLENAEKHSGAVEADVTITNDDNAVRATVTDSGVGFSLTDVDGARLGYRDSIAGRLKDIGGNARLFSDPDTGTTVLLEAPRATVSTQAASTASRRNRAMEKIRRATTDREVAARDPDVVGYQDFVGATAASASLGTDYLGVGASVMCAVGAAWGLAVFAVHFGDYPRPAVSVVAWVLFIGAFLVLNITLARRGERLSTSWFVFYVATLAVVVALDFIAIAPLSDLGAYATASVAAVFGLLRVVPLRPPREVLAVSMGLLAAFVLMTGNNLPLTAENLPRQALLICLPVLIPLMALFVVKRFRRLVQLDLERVLVQSTIAEPEPSIGMQSSRERSRLHLAAEELLGSVASGGRALPLDDKTAALAATLGAELRRHLIKEHSDTWLHHAVTESAHLGRAVRLSDPGSLANLFNLEQRDGLLEAVWLLVADSTEDPSPLDVSIGPIGPIGPLEDDDALPDRTVSFPAVITAPGIARQKVDPSTWAAIARLGLFTVSGEGETLRITVQCTVPNPAH